MKLAINGGMKAIQKEGRHYDWPVITDRTKQAVLDQIDEDISIYNRSGIFERFEDKFKNYHGKKHGLLTSSGTAALHSMYVGAELREGDEVICPAYTFYATATPLFFTGATPILTDCDKNGNISPESIKENITENTKAIVTTHMWGTPCQMDDISKIASEHDILLFEDVSHAHGARHNGKLMGSYGDAAAFSLQGKKTLTGGEGGILITDNPEIHYGGLMLGHYNKRCKQEIPEGHKFHDYATTGMGLKLRAHPLAIAIAEEQFENLESIVKRRQECADIMMNGLKDTPGVTIPNIDSLSQPSWYAFILQYDSQELDNLPIEKFYNALQAEGCSEVDRPGSTCPLSEHKLFQNPGELFPAYAGKFSYKTEDFPNAKKFHENTLKLPVWHDNSGIELAKQYVAAINKVATNYKELK